MPEHPDVLIVGGGVIGLTTAYFLARERVRVAVADKGDFGQEASWAGAGILPPGKLSPNLHPYDQLRAHGSTLYPTLSAELRERTGIDNGYLRCGGLEFPEAGTTSEEWRTDGAEFVHVDRKSLLQIEPAASPEFTEARYLPDLAQLRNPRHVKALLTACAGLGVTFQPGAAALGFDRHGDRITALRSSAGTFPAGQFLIAAGAWSDGLLEPFGFRPGIRPVRGQIALVNTGVRRLHRVLVQGKRYVVPRPDGRVLIGATEEDAGFDKRTTALAIGELIAFGLALAPVLAHAQVERCWAGLRPGSPDGLPFLGPVPGVTNLYVAAGHFRSGILLSPGTALVMKELLLGKPLSVALDPFRLDRVR